MKVRIKHMTNCIDINKTLGNSDRFVVEFLKTE
jgi:hypothetical protein